jgi:hypothetical protein
MRVLTKTSTFWEIGDQDLAIRFASKKYVCSKPRIPKILKNPLVLKLIMIKIIS